jgi:hypothetical protein
MKFFLRCLALVVLMAICTQMAVCMAEDCRGESSSSATPVGSDCSCHDCGCCSLHTGFPPQPQNFLATLIERIPFAPAPFASDKPRPRLDHPPRP